MTPYSAENLVDGRAVSLVYSIVSYVVNGVCLSRDCFVVRHVASSSGEPAVDDTLLTCAWDIGATKEQRHRLLFVLFRPLLSMNRSANSVFLSECSMFAYPCWLGVTFQGPSLDKHSLSKG